MNKQAPKKLTGLLVISIMTLSQIATDIYLASFPAIRIDLATTNANVQLTIGVFFAGFGVSQLIYGPLSDRYGRKPLLVFGIGLYLLMSIACSMASSISILLIARFVQGIGGGSCSVLSRAIARDIYSRNEFEKFNLYQTMTWAFVPIFAPLLGSYIQKYFGWRFNFFALSFISLIALLACSFLLKETIQEKEKILYVKLILHDYFNIFKYKNFLPYLICVVAVWGMLVAFNISAPLILQNSLKLSSVQYGWSIFFVAMSYVLGTFINRILMSRINSNTIVNLGISILILSNLILFWNVLFKSLTLFTLLVPIFIMQLGAAFIFPICAAEAMRPFSNKIGRAAAVFGCTLHFSGMLVSTIVSYTSYKTLTSLAIIFLVLTCIIIFFFPNKELLVFLRKRYCKVIN